MKIKKAPTIKRALITLEDDLRNTCQLEGKAEVIIQEGESLAVIHQEEAALDLFINLTAPINKETATTINTTIAEGKTDTEIHLPVTMGQDQACPVPKEIRISYHLSTSVIQM